jgi:hypothetical protein
MISSLLLRLSSDLPLCGLVLGIIIGSGQNFTLAPARDHLNLVGFRADVPGLALLSDRAGGR